MTVAPRRNEGLSGERSERQKAKRRRLDGPADCKTPTKPFSFERFHNQLQENLVGRLFDLLAVEAELATELETITSSLVELAQARISHAKVMAECVTTLNHTLADATRSTNITRQLSAEAVQLSEDVRTCITRFTSYVVELVRGPFQDNYDHPPEALSFSSEQLFSGWLCEGLFEGLELASDVDYDAKWAATVASLATGVNSRMIASSWTEVFATFSPGRQYPEAFLAATVNLRLNVLRIVRAAACVQLDKMIRIDAQLGDLTERLDRMRSENRTNWQIFAEHESKQREADQRVVEIKQKLPVERERLLDHVLQLVILSKGP